MSTDGKSPDNVLVFRTPTTGTPVAVPSAIVTAMERPYAAYTLRLGGMSWEAVGAAMDYPDARSAAADVTRYLDAARALVAEYSQTQMLHLELSRLDALQTAVWPKAMEGSLPAVGMALSIVSTRVKLLGLDTSVVTAGPHGPTTVVVSDAEDDTEGEGYGYLSALTRAAERQGPSGA